MKKDDALKRFYEVMRLRRMSPATIKAYCGWIGQYIAFLSAGDRSWSREERIGRFLTRLVVKHNVSASTQKQALCAIVRFYKWVLREEVGELSFSRSHRPKRLPEVFSREEAWRVLDRLEGDGWLWAAIMYGCGLRLEEVARLRVKSVDIDRRLVMVRDGKGGKDRTVPLPELLVAPLQKHLRNLQIRHQECVAAGIGVSLPDALDRKYPLATYAWEWFHLFPATAPARAEKWGGKLHHVHKTAIQKRIRRAILAARIAKKAGCHTFRHSFATHWLESAEGSHEAALLRLQKLMGHSSPQTTMIYLHLLKPKSDVPSPLDVRPQTVTVRLAA